MIQFYRYWAMPDHNDTIITVETKKGSNMMIEEEWL